MYKERVVDINTGPGLVISLSLSPFSAFPLCQRGPGLTGGTPCWSSALLTPVCPKHTAWEGWERRGKERGEGKREVCVCVCVCVWGGGGGERGWDQGIKGGGGKRRKSFICWYLSPQKS